MARRANPRNPLLPHNRPKRGKHLVTPKNEALVQMYSGQGLPQRQIATLLDIDVNTLIKNYRRELDIGLANTNVLVGKAAVDQATSGTNFQATWKWGEKFMDWGAPKDASPASGQVNIFVHTGIHREGENQKTVSPAPDCEVIEHAANETVDASGDQDEPVAARIELGGKTGQVSR